jgi:hypothetical protein
MQLSGFQDMNAMNGEAEDVEEMNMNTEGFQEERREMARNRKAMRKR